MLTFWSLVLVWNIGQNPQQAKPADPPKTQVPAAEVPPKAADAAAAEKGEKGASADAKAAKEPDSEQDKFIRQQADRLDKVTNVSAEIVYITRNQDQTISQKGVYKLGPNNRVRMELAYSEGPTAGKRTFVSDGATAYTINEFGEMRRADLVKMERLRPLLDDKNITDEHRQMFWGGLVPYQKPGAMLRSFLDTMTFSDRRDDKLGNRAVVKLEGKWRKSAVELLAGGDRSKTIDDIDPRVPRYVTLVLDKETGWPLQMEMFQRLSSVGVFKPFITLKFSIITIGQTVPESDFKYTPPTNVQVQDITPMLESTLKRMIDAASAQRAAAAKPADAKAPAPPPAEKKP